MTESVYWIWLSSALGPGSRAAEAVLDAFDSDINRIYASERSELEQIEELKSDKLAALLNKDLTEAEEIADYCDENGVCVLYPTSEYYPKRLYRIRSKPLVLYCLGNIIQFDSSLCIAVVGTRELSYYGDRCAYTTGYDLARGGAVVVSGMAKGIDARAHRGCLDAGGLTACVLGCGIDRIYPKENTDLWHYIRAGGMIMTEYKPGTPPIGSNFPIRNRIISGLCQGTVVVEADNGSGALITARAALYQGRDIFAFPGKVGEYRSMGTNELIKNGAKMITSAADVLAEYADLYPDTVHIENISKLRSPKSGNIMKKITSTVKYSYPVTRVQNTYCNDILKENRPLTAYNKPTEKKRPAVTTASELQRASQAPYVDRLKPNLSVLKEDELSVYNAMPDNTAVTADTISKSGIPISKVMTMLTMLELKGFIESLPGSMYKKNI